MSNECSGEMPPAEKAKMQQLCGVLAQHVSALLLWDTRDVSPAGIVDSASCGLIDTGTTRLVVTAAHVVSRFLELRALHPEMQLLLAGHGCPFQDLSEWPVLDISTSLDITALSPPPSFEAAAIGKAFFVSHRWPPPRVGRGELCCFVGFPGLHRYISLRGVEVAMSPVVDFVTSSSQRHFIMADEEMERVGCRMAPNLAEFGPLGGLSGAPVFVNRQLDGPLQLEFCGVMYEASDLGGIHATMLVTHADHLSDDGRIQEQSV